MEGYIHQIIKSGYLFIGREVWLDIELEVDGTMSRGLARNEFTQLSEDPFSLLVCGEDPWVQESKGKRIDLISC